MKFEIKESHPGEFDSCCGNDLREKLEKAFEDILAGLEDDVLEKGVVQTAGEMRVLEHLSEMMSKLYRKRMVQLRADMRRVLEDSVGRP
jgi:hypothetical protein